MPLEWNDAMSTGVARIDAQHKELILHINKLTTALHAQRGPNELKPILDFLAKYAVQHFKEEEACMDQYKCPFAGNNRRAHEEFLKKFTALKADLETKGATAMLAVKVETELNNWLKGHIMGVDCKLKACVNDRAA